MAVGQALRGCVLACMQPSMSPKWCAHICLEVMIEELFRVDVHIRYSKHKKSVSVRMEFELS